ncbi:MAG: amidohydrolase family protein [Actinomycetia bacterium]|nr:amidohydrolase family protein [Actinomycetes bacterium]
MKKIDFETHFATQGWVDALNENKDYPRFERDPETNALRLVYHPAAREPYGDALVAKLVDLGEGRLRLMDQAGVDTALISLTTPGVEQFDTVKGAKLAREANDVLAEAIDKYPDRYGGFCALPVRDVDASVKELERAIKELGFVGWKTHANYGDSYLDDKRYWPILAKAEELDALIYLHPTVPSIPDFWTYGIALAGPPFGFGLATALAMVRLVLSGAFDAFPKLQIVLGHYGEGLPFLMQRIDWAYERPHVKTDRGALAPLKRMPSDYLHDNMVVSTSGNYLPAAFKCTREALGMDKILLGTDYPYEDMDEAFAFLEGLGLAAEEKDMLYGGNADRLLRS